MTGVGKLDRVAHQVREHLLEAHRINQYVTADSGVDVELQHQTLLPGQAVEHPRHGFDQFAQVGTFRRKADMARFDAYHIEDIADQFQQTFCRVVCHFNRRPIEVSLLGTLEGKFEHADHGAHRRTDFVAHGRQERGFGAARLVSQLFRRTQLLDEFTAFADIDPAADHASDFTRRVVIRLDPVVNDQPRITDMQRAIHLVRFVLLDDAQVVVVKLQRLLTIALAAFEHGLADHVLFQQAKCLQIIIIAGDKPTFTITYVDGMRRAVDQRAHELQLIAQQALCPAAFADLPANIEIPRQRSQDNQERASADLVDQRLVIAPRQTRKRCNGTPPVENYVQLIRRNAQQRLVQNADQFGIGTPRGESEEAFVHADDVGDTQAVAVDVGDVVARTVQRGNHRVRSTVLHVSQGAQNCFVINDLDVGVVLEQLTLSRTFGHCDALAAQLLQA